MINDVISILKKISLNRANKIIYIRFFEVIIKTNEFIEIENLISEKIEFGRKILFYEFMSYAYTQHFGIESALKYSEKLPLLINPYWKIGLINSIDFELLDSKILLKILFQENNITIINKISNINILKSLVNSKLTFEFESQDFNDLSISQIVNSINAISNNSNNSRNYVNMKSWISKITDEDDSDQIRLWAKQVAKGKMTEEEFGEKVKGM